MPRLRLPSSTRPAPSFPKPSLPGSGSTAGDARAARPGLQARRAIHDGAREPATPVAQPRPNYEPAARLRRYELGPLLAAILVAGRSGSAMTAELGVMRLTEELDALRVMGVSPFRRLVLPKVLALGLLMPLVAFWASMWSILGGMLIADLELGLGFRQFLAGLPDAIPVGTYWLSLWKSLVFGVVIGVVACFYGLRVAPNTASLGAETTRSVVVSITMVIVLDALFAVAFRDVGWHG